MRWVSRILANIMAECRKSVAGGICSCKLINQLAKSGAERVSRRYGVQSESESKLVWMYSLSKNANKLVAERQTKILGPEEQRKCKW